MGTDAGIKGASLRRVASPSPSPRSPVSQPVPQPVSQSFSTLYVCFCIGYYFLVSLSLTFINKTVLTKFACPLFMTWLQFVVAFFCLKALGYAGRFFPAISNHIGICQYSFSKDIFTKTAALGFAYVAMVGVTNVTLFKVNLLLFQFVRALVIPFSIVITYRSNGSLPSLRAGVACLFVVVGFFIGTLSDTDESSDKFGIAVGVLSSLLCAIYGVQVKRTLAVLGNDTFKTLYYNTVWGLVLLVPFIFVFERGILLPEVTKLYDSAVQFAYFILAAVMGFMISIAYVLNIRCSTPLTSHIVGSSKSALQSVLVLAFHDPSFGKPESSLLNKFGLFLVMAASLAYSYIQFQAGSSKPATNPQKRK